MLKAADLLFFQTHGPFEPTLAKVLHKDVGVLKCTYDFAVDAGAVGSINLKDQNGELAVLPTGAIIKQVMVSIVTAFTSTGGTGTIALTANSAGDLLAAVDADTLSGISSGIPVGTAATMVKLTAQRQLIMAIATAALTAGKADFYIEYVL
jgi:hypothetical protein